MNELKNIKNRAEEMEKNGKVDIAILDDLEKFNDKIMTIGKKWISVDHNDGFYFYQAVRNVELILGRMMERFRTAKENQDNPQIALDTLDLIPIMDLVVELTDVDYNLEKNNVEIVNKLLEHTRDLRDMASVKNLIENDSENIINMDKKTLGETYEKIMGYIDVPTKLPLEPNVEDDYST